MQERRASITDPAALAALAHPVRLDVLGYLMASGPATASACARAVGDSPSNCSYHLRVLARHDLVRAVESADGRERPWEALVTGFTLDPDDQGDSATALVEASMQLDHHLAREYLRTRDTAPASWRSVDTHASYGVRVTPDEMRRITAEIDAIVRPFIAATRANAPADAAVAHVSLLAFPRAGFGSDS